MPATRRGLRRPQLTGRAAVLVLVVAVLTVSYASSLKAYLQQRAHITDLKQQIAQREADINALEREKSRWHDPAYVQSQARARFGYLMPGETSYVVLGEDGKPLEAETLAAPQVGDRQAADGLVGRRVAVGGARRQPARARGQARPAHPHRRPDGGVATTSCPCPSNDLLC